MPASDLPALNFLAWPGASGKPKLVGSRGSMVAKLKLEVIDGRAPPGVEPVAEFESTREISPGPDTRRIDRLIAIS